MAGRPNMNVNYYAGLASELLDDRNQSSPAQIFKAVKDVKTPSRQWNAVARKVADDYHIDLGETVDLIHEVAEKCRCTSRVAINMLAKAGF